MLFGVLVVGGTSYELYNETNSHYRSKHRRHSEKYPHKSEAKRSNDYLGLFNKSRKSQHKSHRLSEKKTQKISPRTSRKLFNVFKDTLEKTKTSKKLRSHRSRKHSSSMTSSEKRQYYLNKFKHNVHKTKKRRRRIYI